LHIIIKLDRLLLIKMGKGEGGAVQHLFGGMAGYICCAPCHMILWIIKLIYTAWCGQSFQVLCFWLGIIFAAAGFGVSTSIYTQMIDSVGCYANLCQNLAG
jgi:hypothetical protein